MSMAESMRAAATLPTDKRPDTLLIFSAVVLLALPVPAAQLYVATSGSDSNSGTRRKPFATLERARDEARRFTQNGKLPKGGLTIWLRGGDYLRTNALELTTADAGTPNSPIVWRACKGETVRLLGGRKLSGFEPVTDPAITRVASSTCGRMKSKFLSVSYTPCRAGIARVPPDDPSECHPPRRQ